MSKKLIFVAGSPAPSSRSSRLLDAVANHLQGAEIQTRRYSLNDFDPRSLLYSETTAPAIQSFIEDVKTSDGIVVATPVYKATFSGALKLILDLIPPDALARKVALTIATARQPSHLDRADAGLVSIFAFFRVRTRVTPLLLTDDNVFDANAPERFNERTERAIQETAKLLKSATTEDAG